MRKWLIDNFLPMWAKETVLAENRRLKRENKHLGYELRERMAYMDGLEQGLRTGRRYLNLDGGKK